MSITAVALLISWFVGSTHNEEQEINTSSTVVIVEDTEQKEALKSDDGCNENDKENRDVNPYSQLVIAQSKLVSTFCWPADAEKLVEIQKRTEGVTQLSNDMKLKLDNLGILRKRAGETRVIEDIAVLARNTGILMPRKKIRVAFDAFSIKRRPGLSTSSEEEDGAKNEVRSRKKSDSETENKKKEEIEKWKMKNTEVFRKEKENLLNFVKREKQGYIRSS